MSDSRRRSSRKHRDDELTQLEQTIASRPGSSRTKHEEDAEAIEADEHGDLMVDEDGDEDEDVGEEHDEEDEDALAEEGGASRRSGLSNLLSGGLFGGPMATPGMFRSLLQQIQSEDPSMQLIGLTELANLLSISTEDSLTGYMNIDSFVAPLVNIMRGPDAFGEDNPEMMLLACRSLANLMEAVPPASANIAYGGAIPVLCSKLLEIEYIDLAEQALSTLEKISKDYPASVVREGGLNACLAYLDFFSTNVQRTAVSTAANCARNIPMDAFGSVKDVMPILQNVIMSGDAKVVESACLCLTRIIASFRSAAAKLDQLFTPTLLANIVQLLSPVSQSGSVSDGTRTRLLHALSYGTTTSDRMATELLKLDLVGVLYQILTGLDKPLTAEMRAENSVVVLQALIHRPKEQIVEVLNLVSAILPVASQEDNKRADTFRKDCPAAFQDFAEVMLPTLLDIFNSTVNSNIRQTTLHALMRLLAHLETATLLQVVEGVPLASFIAGVLSSKDGLIVANGVRLAQMLLKNAEQVYARKLETEGCIAIVEDLSAEVPKLASPTRTTRPFAEDDDEDDEGDEDEDMPDEEEEEEIAPEQARTPAAEEAHNLAKSFLAQYKQIEMDGTDKHQLKQLRQLSKRLQDQDALVEIARRITDDVSSYYLRAAGVLDALSRYLASPANVKRFLSVFDVAATNKLVSKLQELLSRGECFEVRNASIGRDDRNAASVLAKQIKLKLVADDPDIPKAYSNLMVSIHAIATFKALDSYLRPRVAVGTNRASRTGTPVITDDPTARASRQVQNALAQLEAAGGTLPDDLRARLAAIGVAAAELDDVAAEGDETIDVEVSNGESLTRSETGSRTETPKATPRRSTRTPLSYAAAVQSAPVDWHIQFEVDGTVVHHDTTIFGAVYKSVSVGDASVYGMPSSHVYLVKFRRVKGSSPEQSLPRLNLPDIAASLADEPNTLQVLQLLDRLQELRGGSYVNAKLTAKLNRQLEEPLIVASSCLPDWSQDLPRAFPFLFPFETRYLFLQSTSFGYSRSMSRWQKRNDKDDGRAFLGRLQRQKVRISRTRMLESAVKVLELYGSSPALLEVEYFDEVGTGLGPTLEFYAAVSRDFARRKLGLWRDEEHSQHEFVSSPAGLFPSPGADERKVSLFKALGTLLARAMLDSRITDVALSAEFIRLTRKRPAPTVAALTRVDPHLAKSLRYIESKANDAAGLAELGLDMTYPGSSIELVPNGADVDVTPDNVADYLDKVLDLTLGSGIAKQLDAFEAGFSSVFPYAALRAFSPEELTMVFGRAAEDWSARTLSEAIHADHGFNASSATIRSLIDVLSAFDQNQRREFLQFVTGSPRLPIGGFKNLTPHFTIVCKPHEAPLTADDYLPSVMTCVNYLKLPDYSTADVLRTKLLVAIREGSGSFHLS